MTQLLGRVPLRERGIDYLGSDKIDVLLVNDQGNSEKEADKLIDIYAMKAYSRVRMSTKRVA